MAREPCHLEPSGWTWLRTAGYRLVYQVNDKVVVVTVIAVGKRNKGRAYRLAEKRV